MRIYPLMILALLGCVTGALASTDVPPARMDLRVFVTLKVEVTRALTPQALPVQAPLPPPPGAPDEERAMERIRALAPVLSSTAQDMQRRIETIHIIAVQGMAGPVARELAVQAVGQCLTNTNHGEPVQLAAVQALQQIGGGSRSAPQTIARVLSGTANPIPVRLAAINALGVITRPETLPDTLAALERVAQNTNHGEEVQNATVDALGWIARCQPAAVELLSRWLQNTSRPLATRRRVVATMLSIEDPAARAAAVAGLTQVLLNTNHAEELQLAAVEAIAFLGRFNSPALSAFARVLSGTQNPIAVRLAILRVISAAPPENALETVQVAAAVLRNYNHGEQVQVAAVQTIAAVGAACPDAAVAALGECLRGTSFAMATRAAALQTLARVGHGIRLAEQIVEAVVNDRSHSDSIRQLAQTVLTQLYQ